MAGAACGKTLRWEKFLEIGGCEDLHGQIMLGSWSDSWQAQCLVNLGRCWTAFRGGATCGEVAVSHFMAA